MGGPTNWHFLTLCPLPPPSCTPLPPVGRRAPARTAGKATGPRARPHGGPPSHLLHFQTTTTSFPPCHAIHTCTDSKSWVWGDPPPPYTHTPAHVSCHLTPCGGPSPSLAPFFTDLAGPDRPLPAQTHTPNMPPHVHFHPPSAGARWRRGGQPTPRAGNIDSGANESIEAPGCARCGAAAAVVVCDCAVLWAHNPNLGLFHPHPRPLSLERPPTDTAGRGY